MYIVWRPKPVIGNKPTTFLLDDPDNVGTERAIPWKPLTCPHRGAGRVAWTPLVMMSRRDERGPRQTLLKRLPTIRSCCIANSFVRAAWWEAIEIEMQSWAESGEGPLADFIAHDKKALVASLLEYVPKPSRQGAAVFKEYRDNRYREQAAQVRWEDVIHNPSEEEHAFIRKMEAEKLRKKAAGQKAAEERRKREEQARREKRAQEERWQKDQATYTAWIGVPAEVWKLLQRNGFDSVPEAFGVLKLTMSATIPEIKARRRDLARRLHPDTSSSEDTKLFARVQGAYEIVKAYCQHRDVASAHETHRGHYAGTGTTSTPHGYDADSRASQDQGGDPVTDSFDAAGFWESMSEEQKEEFRRNMAAAEEAVKRHEKEHEDSLKKGKSGKRRPER